jgi:hypothetical protein
MQMGAYFGVGEREDLYIWEVCDMALVAPLPPGWSEAPAAGDGPELPFRCLRRAGELVLATHLLADRCRGPPLLLSCS